jgi:sugar lactone lactonase YvrE
MTWHFERIAGPASGPMVGAAWDGSGLLYSVPDEMVVRRWDPRQRQASDFRRYTGRINGLAVAGDGSVFAAQESGRRVIEFVPDGSARVTATRFAGAIHNFPCDVAVDRQQRVWFSDSHTGLQVFGPRIYPLLEHASVLRLEKDDRRNWVIRRVTFDTRAPRAVLLAEDEKTLLVSEGEMERDGPRELRAYPLRADGTVAAHDVLHAFGADHRGKHRGIEGLCRLPGGRVVGCGGAPGIGPGPALYLFGSDLRLAEVHAFVPAVAPMRCAFGDGVLYVTGGDGALYASPIA